MTTEIWEIEKPKENGWRANRHNTIRNKQIKKKNPNTLFKIGFLQMVHFAVKTHVKNKSMSQQIRIIIGAIACIFLLRNYAQKHSLTSQYLIWLRNLNVRLPTRCYRNKSLKIDTRHWMWEYRYILFIEKIIYCNFSREIERIPTEYALDAYIIHIIGR